MAVRIDDLIGAESLIAHDGQRRQIGFIGQLRGARALGHAGEQIERARAQERGDHVEERGGREALHSGTESREEDARGNDDRRTDRAGQLLRGEQGDDAEDQCCKPTVVQPRTAERRRRAFIAEQHAHANDRVHTDLGEDRKHRGDRRTCGRIRGGQPEIERPASRLDQEGHAEKRDTCIEQAAVGRSDRAPAQSELRHVERAGHAVDQRRADQEQERGDQIDHDVVQPGFHARGTRAVQDQSVGCGQQHLEKDEQAEQIACQERTVEPHEQELQQRLVMHAHALPARD